MVHAQAAHMINIYKIGDKNDEHPKGTAAKISETAAVESSESVGGIAEEPNGGDGACSDGMEMDTGTDEVSCLLL